MGPQEFTRQFLDVLTIGYLIDLYKDENVIASINTVRLIEIRALFPLNLRQFALTNF